MDGNGRWAKARHMPRTFGHKKGVDSVRSVIKGCMKHGVANLTLFAFSSENWKRPEEEVSSLMALFMFALEREAALMVKNNIRLRIIGDISGFSTELQAKIRDVEQLTRHGTALNLMVAANYGGRWDIAQSLTAIAKSIQTGERDDSSVTEADISAHLSTADIPDPDLFIRTGGERRISNFLLWQLAYAELYFTDTLWPEFDQDALALALSDFAARQRRFGMTGDQINHKDAHHA